MVKDSKNDPVQISSSVASSVFHEDSIGVVATNTIEEKIFHISSFFFHDSSIYSSIVWNSDPLNVLEEGSMLGDVAFSLLGSMLLMYSYMIASTNFSEFHRRWMTPTFTWSWSHLLWFEAKVSSVSSCIWICSHPGWFGMQVQMMSIFSCFHCWRNQVQLWWYCIPWECHCSYVSTLQINIVFSLLLRPPLCIIICICIDGSHVLSLDPIFYSFDIVTTSQQVMIPMMRK